MKDIRNVPTERLGCVKKMDNGDTVVQFVRILCHSPEQVWNAITNADSLAEWFPGFQLEHRQGGNYNIWFGGECEGPAHVSGTVDTYDPPNELRCGSMCWKLQTVAQGCQLTFTDIVRFNQDQRGDFETTNSVLAGWHFYVDRLEDVMAGVLDKTDTIEYDYSQIEVPQRAAL